ncbi:PREDICTED: histidine protein methyltransferase 1 homolog [Nicrophorus vespilloides]|uniref:protein-histidine N-methyltransferase n=1 Tax=Nicrophorus vespilloides TaxID=110193 RepID=A0ABM1NEF9_NICVS|nr:PREDICTED: histidine protein methyltransferase 1 homolog [Nicrophorus vespilloides]
MFKFGFSADASECKVAEECKESAEDDACKGQKWLPSEKISIGNNVVDPELLKENCTSINSLELEDCCTIRYVSTVIVSELVRKKQNEEDSIFKAEQNNSDLITAVYEGGLKIWECTYDVLDYIYDGEKLEFKDRKVLDLGCGAGIIGIYSLLNGASNVCLQDYNPEVIKYITIPNVLLNAGSKEEAQERCDFYCGDWGSFANLLKVDAEEEKFDYIFSSETIYNCQNYDKLLSVFERMLKRKTGVLYLAAKTYYFGVGGGTRQFEKAMDKAGCFKYETCWKCPNGVQREILKISLN